MVVNWAVSEIDLPGTRFWELPAARDAAFGVLRLERPVAFFPEPALPLLPGHARMRRRAAAAFTPRTARQFSARVEAACPEIIDDVTERGECDFAAEVTVPLPSRLICNLLGVPRADQAWVTGQGLMAYGRDDPEHVPGMLEDPSRGALAVLDAATHGVLLLDRHPGQRTAWQQDFARLAPAAAGERVRWSSPVISFRRTPARDLEVTGDPQWLRSSAINGIKHRPARSIPSRPGG